jgi:triosephosphate isomerase
MGRKFFVGGNWKMNGDKASIEAICNTLKSGDTDPNVGKWPNIYRDTTKTLTC